MARWHGACARNCLAASASSSLTTKPTTAIAGRSARRKGASTKLDAEGKAGATQNNAAARLWISGIEPLQRVVGQPVLVYGLPATPFFRLGSGYSGGALFPGVVSGFSLIDAIRCGIVKVARCSCAGPAGRRRSGLSTRNRYIQEHSDVKLPKAGAA